MSGIRPVPGWPRLSPAAARPKAPTPPGKSLRDSARTMVMLVPVAIGVLAAALNLNYRTRENRIPATVRPGPVVPPPVFTPPIAPPMPAHRAPPAPRQVPRPARPQSLRRSDEDPPEPRNSITIEDAPVFPHGQKVASVVLGDDEQFAVNLAIVDAEFDPPQVGHPFSGRFTVRTFGPSYWAPEDVEPPKFILTIYRGGDALVSDTNGWGPALASNQQVVVEWKTERLHDSPLGTVFVPSPGEYRCRVKLYTGGSHSRTLDHWEARRETE